MKDKRLLYVWIETGWKKNPVKLYEQSWIKSHPERFSVLALLWIIHFLKTDIQWDCVWVVSALNLKVQTSVVILKPSGSHVIILCFLLELTQKNWPLVFKTVTLSSSQCGQLKGSWENIRVSVWSVASVCAPVRVTERKRRRDFDDNTRLRKWNRKTFLF